MTQGNDICLPTPLSVQLFGRPEDWEWIEPQEAEPKERLEPEANLSTTLEEQRLSA